MKKIWNIIDKCWGGFLGLFDNKAFAFCFALVLTVLGFVFAEPNAGIPKVNVYFLAWLVGTLMTILCLFGTEIVKKSEGYNLASAVWGAFGSFGGVLISMLLVKLAVL